MEDSGGASTAAADGSQLAHFELCSHAGTANLPVLVMLHATGFLGRMFEPMARHLCCSFRCIAIDMPGHGESSGVRVGPDARPQDLAALVAAKLASLGLHGCYCFGHSFGGCMALMVEALHPGTFTAIYAFEPVCSTHAEMERIRRSPSRPVGSLLSEMALKRRRTFPSRHEATQSFERKPPFSLFYREALELYVQHGLRSSADGQGVELSCSPEEEANVYRSLEPPPAMDYTQVSCPVVIAVSQDKPGMHQRLAVLGKVVQQEIKRSRLDRYETLTHLGPFEDPALVASTVKSALLSFAARRAGLAVNSKL